MAGWLTGFSRDTERVVVQSWVLQRGIARVLASGTPVALRLLTEAVSSQ